MLVRQPVDTYSYRWSEDPIFLQLSPERLGPVAFKEILETYYRTRTFRFVHGELECVKAFLENEFLVLRPADHVRRLHLQLQPFRYALTWELESMRNGQPSFHQTLESLAALRSPRTAIEVHVDLAQERPDDENFESLLGNAAILVFQVIELVEMLRRGGLKIALTLEGRWDGQNSIELLPSSTLSSEDCVRKMELVCR